MNPEMHTNETGQFVKVFIQQWKNQNTRGVAKKIIPGSEVSRGPDRSRVRAGVGQNLQESEQDGGAVCTGRGQKKNRNRLKKEAENRKGLKLQRA